MPSSPASGVGLGVIEEEGAEELVPPEEEPEEESPIPQHPVSSAPATASARNDAPIFFKPKSSFPGRPGWGRPN